MKKSLVKGKHIRCKIKKFTQKRGETYRGERLDSQFLSIDQKNCLFLFICSYHFTISPPWVHELVVNSRCMWLKDRCYVLSDIPAMDRTFILLALYCMLFFLALVHLSFWQNLKMKISNPRFLIFVNQENMKLEFPACLTKKIDSVQSDAHPNPNIMSDTVFSFPEVSIESLC